MCPSINFRYPMYSLLTAASSGGPGSESSTELESLRAQMQGEPNPLLPTNGLCTVLPTKRGYASGAISCCLNAQSSVPAATAAVSARRMSDPSPTVSNPASSSALSHPPSGPIATTGRPRCGGLPPGHAKAVGLPVREARDPSVETAATSGNQGSSALGRGLPGHPAQALHRFGGALALPANHRPGGEDGHDPVDTQFGQLLHHPLRAVPLRRGEGHCHRRLGQRGQLYRPDRVQGGTGRSAACVSAACVSASCVSAPGAWPAGVCPSGDHATAGPTTGTVTGHDDLAVS